MLAEAAHSADPERQQALERKITALSPAVAAAGISLKYSKKVRGWIATPLRVGNSSRWLVELPCHSA